MNNRYAIIVYNKDNTHHTVYNGNSIDSANKIYDDLSSDKAIYHIALYDCTADLILESR